MRRQPRGPHSPTPKSVGLSHFDKEGLWKMRAEGVEPVDIVPCESKGRRGILFTYRADYGRLRFNYWPTGENSVTFYDHPYHRKGSKSCDTFSVKQSGDHSRLEPTELELSIASEVAYNG